MTSPEMQRLERIATVALGTLALLDVMFETRPIDEQLAGDARELVQICLEKAGISRREFQALREAAAGGRNDHDAGGTLA